MIKKLKLKKEKSSDKILLEFVENHKINIKIIKIFLKFLIESLLILMISNVFRRRMIIIIKCETS